MGRRAEAIAAYEESAAILRRLVDAQPGVFRFQDHLAKDYHNIAVAQAAQGKLAEATASERRAVATWRKVAEANPAATTLGNNVAFGLNSLAHDLIQDGRPGEALEALDQARPILQRLGDADPAAISFPRNLAWNYEPHRPGPGQDGEGARGPRGASEGGGAPAEDGRRASLGRPDPAPWWAS